VPDNLKSGIAKTCRYEPDANPTYAEMARHYGVAVIPARVRKPRDKGMVDCGVGAGTSIQPGDVLPLALKAGAGFTEIMAGNQKKQPRARLTPIKSQGLRQPVPRAFWFSLKNCVSSRRNIEDMQHQWMPRLYTGILRACLCPK